MSVEIKNDLQAIYNENIQWLNFAELKNGALMALSVALISAVGDLNISFYLQVILDLILVFVAGICLASFIPFLNGNEKLREFIRRRYAKKYKGSDVSENVIFYVDIFVAGKNKYINTVKNILIDVPNNGFSKFEDNYIEQIIQISTIASIKYFFFKGAASIAVFACAMAVVCLIVA